MTLEDKMNLLRNAIREKGKLAVGFSGGVDSSLLARAACDAIGSGALAITIDSELLPRSELSAAKKTAELIGIRHVIVKSHALKNRHLVANSIQRCYHCKQDDIFLIAAEARQNKIECIAFGANISDLSEHRPGIRACEELHLWQPLMDLKFTKEEVRQAAKMMDLPIWNKPAAACLASRIITGEKITRRKLKMVEEAEDFLHGYGLEQVRVRLGDKFARIEVAMTDFDKVIRHAGEIASEMKKIGFTFVTLDLEGYRPGGANIFR